MPRRITSTTDLSHVTTASRAAAGLLADPTTPVVVHWQMSEFPTRIAMKLLAQQRDVLWVVATTERGDIAERELVAEGIDVIRVRTEATGPVSDNTRPFDALRRKLNKEAANREAQYPQPPQGAVTIVPMDRLNHARPLEEVTSWASPLVVFDHVGVGRARWMKFPVEDEDDGLPDSDKFGIRSEEHPISVFYGKSVPLLFIARDELEVALHRGYIRSLGKPTTLLTTRYTKPRKLKVTVIGTNLVFSKYAGGAFLSIRACVPDAMVVGESLIGAMTPAKLSMSTLRALNKSVLKISRPPDGLLTLDRKQTSLPEEALVRMRTRDFIRTAVLATDPSSRAPELVILCQTDVASAAADYAVADAIRLPSWNPHRPEQTVDASPFAGRVIVAASTYPDALAHRAREPRIKSMLVQEEVGKLPTKLARLALSLQFAGQDRTPNLEPDWDVTGRPEDLMGPSTRRNDAVTLFNRILDAALPWSATETAPSKPNLEYRQETFRLYRRQKSWFQGRELGANKTVGHEAATDVVHIGQAQQLGAQ